VLDYLGKIKGELGGFSVNQQQGDTRNGGGQFIDRAVDRLRGGNTPGKQQIYTRQIQAYSGKILDINDQIRQIQEKAAQDMDGNMAVVYEKQIRNLENRKQAIQRNMAEYDKRAQAVLNGTETTPAPVINPITNTIQKGGSKGGSKGGKTITEEKDDFVEINGLINMAAERVSDLQRRIREAPSETMITELRDQLKDAQAELDRLNGKWQDGLQATFKFDDSDVLEKLRDIEGVTIDPKTLTVTANTADAYNQVQQLLESVDGKTVTFAVQPKMETGTSIQNDAGIQAYIASIKQQLETADYGTSLYNGLSAQLADMNTLQNLVGASLKAGLGTAMFDAADATGKDFWTRAMEGGVEDTDWQAIVDKINEKLKELHLEPIQLDFKTGNVKSQAKEMAKDWQAAGSAIQAVGSAISQIEDPAAKVVGTIAQAIASIALAASQAMSAKDTTASGWAWIGAAAAITATMISTIAAIHSATGYATGGMIKGNSYSGDNIGGLVDGSQLVGLNAGEVVLNTAQTSNVAAALTEGGREVSVHGRLVGEDIFISADRYARRSGRGEILTWKHR
jgi:hypothetical protein